MTQLEKYILQLLNESEMRAVEQRLQSDEAFRQEYQDYLLALTAIREDGRKQLKARLKARYMVKRRFQKRLFWASVLTAALGGALLCTWWYVQKKYPSNNPHLDTAPTLPLPATDTLPIAVPDKPLQTPTANATPSDLFAAYYEPYKNEALTGSVRGMEVAPYSYEGYMATYREGHFRKALLQYDSLSQATQSNASIQFLYAQALLHEGYTAEAQILFDQLKNNPAFRYAQAASWYGVLCRVRLGRIDEARKGLAAILDEDQHPFRHEASRLFKALSQQQ